MLDFTFGDVTFDSAILFEAIRARRRLPCGVPL